MRISVSRTYRFPARHHVPEAPAPWNSEHGHDYTVEVIAERPFVDAGGMVVDTDELDRRFRELTVGWSGADLNELLPSTTVEAIAEHLVGALGFPVVEVAVHEDMERCGRARVQWAPCWACGGSGESECGTRETPCEQSPCNGHCEEPCGECTGEGMLPLDAWAP